MTDLMRTWLQNLLTDAKRFQNATTTEERLEAFDDMEHDFTKLTEAVDEVA
jgi:hypothetical protein